MKLLTFNTRTDNPEDGNNNVKYRMPFIRAKLEAEKPDIIGFQELKPHTCEAFKQMLPDYYILGFGRGEDYMSERIPIGIRKDRFDLIEMGGCWLSPTPDVPGSKYPGQSPCPRTIMWATLFDLQTGKRFRIYNTHLDHPEVRDYIVRKQEVHQILGIFDRDTAKEKLPYIFMGDFNTFPKDSELAELDAREDLYDLTASIDVTFHDYGKPDRYQKIDFIYATHDFKLISADTWRDCYDGVWLSDHYPVCVEAELQ